MAIFQAQKRHGFFDNTLTCEKAIRFVHLHGTDTSVPSAETRTAEVLVDPQREREAEETL